MRTSALIGWWATGFALSQFPVAQVATAADQPVVRQLSETPVEVAPVTDERVEQARARLRTSLAHAEQRMVAGSPNDEKWKRYLKWATLTAFANPPADDASQQATPELTELQEAIDRFRSGAEGVELPRLQRIATDARVLFDLLLLKTVRDPQQLATQQKRSLIDTLEREPLLLDPRASFAVEQRLDLFAGIDGAQPVTQVVSDRFGRANLHATLSARLLSRSVNRPVNEVQPVTDCILGTSIRGTGATCGQLNVTPMPHHGAARLIFTMDGNIASRTVGVNGPAQIRSTADTRFTGNKLVQLSREAFAVSPATFRAATSSQTQSVTKRGGGLGSRLVSIIGSRRVAQQKGQADAIAASHAEDRLEQAFNQRVREEISIARRDFEQEVLAPLERRGGAPQRMDFSTTSHAMLVEVLAAGRGQLAAGSPPPPAPTRDLALRLHQSGANHWAAAILSGATLSKTDPDQPAKLNRPMPDWAKRLTERSRARTDEVSDAEFKPWKLTFRRNRPVSFVFDDNQIEVLLHAAELEVGEGSDKERFLNWDFILRFRPVVIDGRVVLERIGEVDPLPTSFDPKSGRGLRGRPFAVRSNLVKELNREVDGKPAIPEEVPLRDLSLREGRGQLSARQMDSNGGWLTTGWDLN